MDYSLLIILAAFLAFIIFSNKKRATAARQLEENVSVGAEVVMLGGIKGKIVKINEDTVVVETTPGTRIEFVKAAVRSVSKAEPEAKPKATKPAEVKKPAGTVAKTTAKKPAK